MKKKVAIVLVVIICLVAVMLVAGRNSDEDKEPQTTVSAVEPTNKNDKDKPEKETEKATEKVTEKTTEATTDIGVFTPDEIEKKDPDEIVEFEIPLVFLESKYQKNLDKFVKDKGYESAELSWNKKNVKIRLRALSYDIYLMKEGISTISAIC